MEQSSFSEKSVFLARPLSRTTLLGVFLLLVIIGGVLYVLTNRENFTPFLYDIHALSCTDADAEEAGGGVYSKNSSRGWADSFRNRIIEVTDSCVGTQVSEVQCQSDNTLKQMTQTCPFGCYEGRCLPKEESFVSSYEESFSSPYPAIWNQTKSSGNQYQLGTKAQFDLSGVAIGKVKLTQQSELVSQASLKLGDSIDALVLNLKLTAFATGCIDMLIRRIDKETGDIKLPLTQQFMFPASQTSGYQGAVCAPQMNATYENQRVVFPISESETEFYILTGDPYHPLFKVAREGRELKAEKIERVDDLAFLSPVSKKELFPFFVSWNRPSEDLMEIRRSEPMTFSWNAIGYVDDQTVTFQLVTYNSGEYGYGYGDKERVQSNVQSFTFPAKDGTGSGALKVPAGKYTLSQISPQPQGEAAQEGPMVVEVR